MGLFYPLIFLIGFVVFLDQPVSANPRLNAESMSSILSRLKEKAASTTKPTSGITDFEIYNLVNNNSAPRLAEVIKQLNEPSVSTKIAEYLVANQPEMLARIVIQLRENPYAPGYEGSREGYREKLLTQAFQKVKAPQELIDRWLKIDEAFKPSIMKKGGANSCERRYTLDEIIYEPMPDHLKKKKSA